MKRTTCKILVAAACADCLSMLGCRTSAPWKPAQYSLITPWGAKLGYERSPDRVDSRAGSYKRGLETQAGKVELQIPKLRTLPFETQIIERYPA
jgi:hypothetical protein